MLASVKNSWRQLHLSRRLALGLGICMIIGFTALFTIIVHDDVLNHSDELKVRAAHELDLLVSTLLEPILLGDYATIEQILNRFSKHADVVEVGWTPERGHKPIQVGVAVLKSRYQRFLHSIFSMPEPLERKSILIGDRNYGDVYLNMSPSVKEREIDGETALYFTLAVALFCSMAVCLGIILRQALGPLNKLDSHIRLIEAAKEPDAIEPEGSPEVYHLISAFVSMNRRLQATHSQLIELKERYETLFNNSPDAYLIMELDKGRIIECNKAAEVMLRGPKGLIVGVTPADLSPPFQPSGQASLAAVVGIIEQTLLHGGHRFEWVHRRFDGTDFWAEVSISLTDYQDRQVMFVAWRDIEERKFAEAEIRDSETRFRHLADTVPVLIWLADTSKMFFYFNKPWLNFTGRTLVQEEGSGWLEGVHPDDLQLCIETYVTCFDAHQPFAMEYRLRCHDGEYRWILDQGAPRYDFDGIFLGYVGGCIDITERKAAEERLIEARQTAESASRTRSAFLAMMSHELRTPMTGVIGMADFLSETTLDQNQRSYVDTMRASAKTLLTILNDILDYSKIDADRLTLHSVAFDAVALTAETVRLFWPKAEENANSIELDAGGLGTLPVKGDPTRIKQVLGNLISNAVKFTKAGRIVIRLKQHDHDNRVCLEFEVEDTGIGIAEADMQRLFLPFSQTDVGATRKFGGTGLGLAISKRLVEMMGGVIGASSRLGRSSHFRFTCLVDRASPAELVSEPHKAMSVRPMSILLAEDNPINRMIVKIGFEQRHHRVTVAENGVLACEAAAAQQFDLILMDMQMPEMDGAEATRRIRNLPAPFSKVPIVALTADVLLEHRAAYMEAGLNDFLVKPIEWSEVDKVLARYSLALTTLHDIGADNEDKSDGSEIDIRDALARVMGDRNLLNILMEDFVAAYADIGSKIEDFYGDGELRELARTAHDLKGVCSNLGAKSLAQAAIALQEAAEGANYEQVKQACDDVRTLLPAVISEARRIADGAGQQEG